MPTLEELQARREARNAAERAKLDEIAIRKFESAKAGKKIEIETAFKKAQLDGVITSAGPTMKSGFEDASIVRQAAEFFERQGVETMTLKDKNGVLHPNITIANALLAADEMAGKYLELWENREAKMAIIDAATDETTLNDVIW